MRLKGKPGKPRAESTIIPTSITIKKQAAQ
jgi:hypothetical protein